jgi:hypothetical protein
MSHVENPAVTALARALGAGGLFAQVLVRREGEGWELRHEADRDVPAERLRLMEPAHLRQLAQFTGAGAFRPLKSAPNLARGWRAGVANAAELGEALERLYPGAVADWFAVHHGNPVVTHYREFTARQSGMYRITAILGDADVADVVRACCHHEFCLKRRLWSVHGLPADDAAHKSLIPCLEPCALLLELARTAARLIKDGAVPEPTSTAEARAQLQEIEAALAQPDNTVREADFAAPQNRRRLRWLREKLARAAGAAERPTP